MDRIVFLNGSLIAKSEARISPFDHGFLYGYALFETMRAYSGRIFRLARHLDRLARSSDSLNIPSGGCDFEKACYDVLRANDLDNARIRLTISLGEGEGTPAPPPLRNPTIFIMASAFKPLDETVYRNGFSAIVSSIRQNSLSPISRMKTANYLNSLMARQEASGAGADEAIMLNEKGNISEGCITNVFLISEGVLLTPNVESGCLPGITREAVIELANELGINTVQREIGYHELLQTDEAFLTNSVLEIVPLREVNNNRIGKKKDKVNPVTERLMQAYQSLVARETKSCI